MIAFRPCRSGRIAALLVLVGGFGGQTAADRADRGPLPAGWPQSPPGDEVVLTSDAGLSVVAFPGRIEAAPGGLADPISITITNNSRWTTPITVEIESAMGWGGAAAATPEITPGGSVMVTMFTRAPGIAGASLDTLIISARAAADNSTRGFASVTASRRACIVDWNSAGGATVQDIFDFLGDYFRQTADFNGVGGTSVQDLFEYLYAYFDGCA